MVHNHDNQSISRSNFDEEDIVDNEVTKDEIKNVSSIIRQEEDYDSYIDASQLIRREESALNDDIDKLSGKESRGSNAGRNVDTLR